MTKMTLKQQLKLANATIRSDRRVIAKLTTIVSILQRLHMGTK